MPKSTMPHIDHTETMVMVEWNENIHVDENNRRICELMKYADTLTTEHAGYVGHRQYLLDKENDLSPSEARLYFRTAKASDIEALQSIVKLHPYCFASNTPSSKNTWGTIMLFTVS